MTIMKTYAHRSATCPGKRAGIAAAALGAIMLAGCSSGHIGEDWQCPLAKGGSCASVAAADPAVAKTGSVPARTTGQPIRLLPRDSVADALPARGPGQAPAIREPGQGSMEARACEAECGFDPLGWLLAGLFGAETDGDPPDAQETKPAMTASAPDMAAAADVAVEAVPAAEEDTGADGLRTGEIVARIWIAPFVDADGVYREASHVRVVLEPAGWRLR